MNKPSVYDFMDYREYLAEYFAVKKKEMPCFSHRYFCKEAGFRTSSVVKLVIDGKRNLSRTSVIKISKAIGLDEREQEYFGTLVLYEKASTPEEKQEHLFRIAQMRGLGAPQRMDRSAAPFYSVWYHTVVRECLAIDTLPQTAEALAKRIRPRVSVAKIRESIEFLKAAGLIEMCVDGRYRPLHQTIATDDEVTSDTIADFNREMIRLALQASVIFPRQQREISGVTLRVSSGCYREIKKRIAIFKKELLYMALKDRDSNRIYQLNVQLFPLLVDE